MSIINTLQKTNEDILDSETENICLKIETPKKKFNSKDYYKLNKEKIKQKYNEKKLTKIQEEKILCNICNGYYFKSHELQHFKTDRHSVREIIQKQYDLNDSLIKMLTKKCETKTISNLQPIEDTFSFDNIYCYKI